MSTVEVIKHVMLGSGAEWVMWLLFGLSALSVTVAGERWLFFRTKTERNVGLAQSLDRHLASGDYEEALALLRPLTTVSARVAETGLRMASRGVAAAERAMQSTLAAERALLDRRLAILSTLGNNAPFLGLLGTVIGVVLAFDALGQAPSAGADGPSTAVMGAIAEALVATAVGIAVALPAVAAFNYFQSRITALLDESETLSNLVLAYLSSDTTSHRGGTSWSSLEDRD